MKLSFISLTQKAQKKVSKFSDEKIFIDSSFYVNDFDFTFYICSNNNSSQFSNKLWICTQTISVLFGVELFFPGNVTHFLYCLNNATFRFRFLNFLVIQISGVYSLLPVDRINLGASK